MNRRALRASRCKLPSPRALENPTSPALPSLTGEGRAILSGAGLGRAGRADFAQKEVAAFLTVTAGLRANAAMIMVVTMSLAFVCARAAGEDARMQLSVNNIVGLICLADQHAGGGGTNVRAGQIRGNTAAKAFDVFGLAHARIGAGSADFRTGGKGLQGLRIVGCVLGLGSWVAAEHQLDGFHSSL